MMKIPVLDLKTQHETIQQEILEAIERVIQSQRFILGEEVEMLERRMAAYCQCRFAIGVSSGTDALLISLLALGIGPGDEVITTPYTFFSTAGSIARTGAVPVFVDIDPLTYNLEPWELEHAITPRTRAIIPVHLFGQCADMLPILDMAEQHGLKVIEDAAQAVGAEYVDGRSAGSMGDTGCLSFFPSKNLGGMGDGGMVLTQNGDLAEKLRVLRVHGAKPKYYHSQIGGNFRLDALQAAILNVKLNYLENWLKQRQENAAAYRVLFKKAGLDKLPGLTLPAEIYWNKGIRYSHTYNQFVIRAPQRDGLKNYLKQRGIETEIYYPLSLHLQECFQDLGYHAGDFPEAEMASRETLALPVFPEMTEDQQAWVVEAVKEFYAQ